MSRRAVEPRLAEVERLPVRVPAEEEPEMVGGVGLQPLRLLHRGKMDLRVLPSEDFRYFGLHRHMEPASVLLSEPLDIGEPGDCVAQRPLRNLHQHVPVLQFQLVGEHRFGEVLRTVDFDSEAGEVPLDAGDRRPRLRVHAVEHDARVEVAEQQTEPPAVLREGDAESAVEVEPYAADRLLCRRLRRRDVCPPLFILFIRHIPHILRSRLSQHPRRLSRPARFPRSPARASRPRPRRRQSPWCTGRGRAPPPPRRKRP